MPLVTVRLESQSIRCVCVHVCESECCICQCHKQACHIPMHLNGSCLAAAVSFRSVVRNSKAYKPTVSYLICNSKASTLSKLLKNLLYVIYMPSAH